MDHDVWLKLAVALGIGLLVGVERERRKGEGPARRSAGVRTFAVGALLGAVSQVLGGAWVLAAAVLAVASLLAVAYARRRDKDPGLTTEAGLLFTVLLGALAMDDPLLAGALGATLAGLLYVRVPIHHFARSVVTERELNDGLILAAAALVVLPIVPNRYMGPFGAFNPRTLWLIVVLVMTMGVIGHVARRLLGPRFGLPVSGLAGGFVSSVATIGSMGHVAKTSAKLLPTAAAGAALSSVATIVQMCAILAVTSRPTFTALLLPLVLAGVVAVAYGVLLTIRALHADLPEEKEEGHAFQIKSALILACTVSVMLILAAAIEAWLGHAGMVIATALAGFADSHAAAASVAALVASGRLEAHDAVIPILSVLSTNAVTKTIVAVTAGRRFAAHVVPGLVLMIAAAWAGAWFVLWR
jgi:uncharacterized membrane protein (DUF4010 family)